MLLINTCSDASCVGTSVHCWKRPICLYIFTQTKTVSLVDRLTGLIARLFQFFLRTLAQSTNPGRWDSSILRGPCAHFWLWNQAVNCEILLRTSHCADFCEDYVFIKNSSYVFKHIFWRICCWLTFVLMQVVSALVFIAGSGHKELSVWSCMGIFACRIFKDGLSSLECSWIQVEINLN